MNNDWAEFRCQKLVVDTDLLDFRSVHTFVICSEKMSSSSDLLKNLPGFVGMASFTRAGLPIQEYGSRPIKHEVSELCSTITQIRNSLSSSILNESISITIETTKKKVIAVESNDIILILYKNCDQKTQLGNGNLEHNQN